MPCHGANRCVQPTGHAQLLGPVFRLRKLETDAKKKTLSKIPSLIFPIRSLSAVPCAPGSFPEASSTLEITKAVGVRCGFLGSEPGH